MKKLLLSLLLVLSSAVPSWANLRGDLNGDGILSPADISVLINYLLNNGDDAVDEQSADVNHNGSVGPEDISVLINKLLNGVWPDEPATEVITVNGVSFTMVTVEGGTFMMGATEDQELDIEEDGDDAFPAHQVTLSGFCIGQTEVTQELWLAVMGTNPSVCNGVNGGQDYGENLQRPVDNVTRNDCYTFITRLNELTGKTFRFLTEAEWEFAARGGNLSQHYMYAGSNILDDVAWYEGNALDWRSPDYGSHTVATKAPNELGLYDMSGNVFEWVEDRYCQYTSEPQTNPHGASSGITFIARGGGFNGSDGTCKVSCRWLDRATYKDWSRGLRLAADDPNCTVMPTISTRLTDNALVITAVGDGDVRLYINGEAVENPYNAVRGSEPYTITAYASAQENGKSKSQCAPVTIVVRALDTPPVTETFNVNGVTFAMVNVDGGTFMMGAGDEQVDAGASERPAHEVTLSDFSIGQTEVTQELWVAVMGTNPTNFRGNLQRPIDCVSWDDCQMFIAELNRLTGRTFRLPTEAEWEFAARGGNKGLGFLYAGSNDIEDVAWYFDNSGWRPNPVASKAPNELGLYDMSGNLDEWCQDWSGLYSSEPQTNPQGPATGTYRICRGGSWVSSVHSCRVTARGSTNPGSQNTDLGFRLAM